MDRFMVNLDRYGNTSSASIPIAVCEALDCGRIEPGDKMVLVGFGAGLTWGALAMEWVAPDRKVSTARRQRRRVWAQFAQVRSALRRLWRRIGALLFGASSESQEQD